MDVNVLHYKLFYKSNFEQKIGKENFWNQFGLIYVWNLDVSSV